MLAALKYGRNRIGIEIDPEYYRKAGRLLQTEARGLFTDAEVVLEEVMEGSEKNRSAIQEQKDKRKEAGLRRRDTV